MDQQMPLVLKVYDKSFTERGVFGDPYELTMHLIRNDEPQGTLVVPNDHPKIGLLTGGAFEGGRYVLEYEDSLISSGYIEGGHGEGAPDGQSTFTLRDDWCLLNTVLGMQDPTATIPSGSTSGTINADYYRLTGPAETVLKTVVVANAATRLGLPVVAAPDQGRGPTITAKWRMHPIWDRLSGPWQDVPLSVVVYQDGDHLVVDVVEPRTFPQRVTPESGIVVDWSWDWAAPTITRAIAAGQGDMAARRILQSVDTMAEGTWGAGGSFIREAAVDANDVATDPLLADRALQARREGRRLTGLSLVLAETGPFRYGEHLRVGDVVTETLSSPTPAEHTVTECVISWNAADGLVVTPLVGDIETHGGISRVRARAISRLQSVVNSMGVDK